MGMFGFPVRTVSKLIRRKFGCPELRPRVAQAMAPKRGAKKQDARKEKVNLSDSHNVLKELRAKIKSHKAFGANYETKKGSTTSMDFQLADYKQNIKQHGHYECGGNLFWIADASAGIPIRQTAVQDSIALLFPTGPQPILDKNCDCCVQ